MTDRAADIALMRDMRLKLRRVEVLLGCFERIATIARAKPLDQVADLIGDGEKDVLRALLLGEGCDSALDRYRESEANLICVHCGHSQSGKPDRASLKNREGDAHTFYGRLWDDLHPPSGAAA